MFVRLFVGAATVLVVLAAATGGATAARSTVPSLTVKIDNSRTSASCGVTIRGRGWTAGDTIEVHGLGSSELQIATANSRGQLKADVSVASRFLFNSDENPSLTYNGGGLPPIRGGLSNTCDAPPASSRTTGSAQDATGGFSCSGDSASDNSFVYTLEGLPEGTVAATEWVIRDGTGGYWNNTGIAGYCIRAAWPDVVGETPSSWWSNSGNGDSLTVTSGQARVLTVYTQFSSTSTHALTVTFRSTDASVPGYYRYIINADGATTRSFSTSAPAAG